MNFVINSNRGVPAMMNGDIFWFQAYPKGAFDKANICANQIMSYVWAVSTNYTITPANYLPIVEAVWPVSINSGNSNVDLNIAFWAKETNPVGEQWQVFLGWLANRDWIYTWTSFTANWTCRIVSNEAFSAGKSVWWKIVFAPVVNLWATVASWWGAAWIIRTPFTIAINSFTITTKLMNTVGTLVTIGTTTNVASWQASIVGITWNVKTKRKLPTINQTFTPIVAAAWDRLVLEINMTVTVTYWTAWWGQPNLLDVTQWCWLELWYPWSDKSLFHDQAFRPIQVSVA